MLSHTSTAKTLTTLTMAIPSTTVSINEIIVEAKKIFVDGQEVNQDLIRKIHKDPSIQSKFRPLDHDGDFLQFKDPDFPNYNANRIAETNFIAAAGPKSPRIIDFFKNTVFHPTLDIHEIIAIGSTLGSQYSNRRDLDFCDYMISMYPDSDFNFFTNDSEQIDITIDKCTGKYQRPEFSSRCFPESIIKSELTIRLDKTEGSESKDTDKPQIKKINVTLLPIPDGGSIKLAEMKSNDPYYEVLWNLYQKYLTQLIVVHCAAGVGRTGQLMLTFELVKHHEEIAAIKDIDLKAKTILDILNRLRLNRPALVFTSTQLEHAIRSADALYQYGLKNGKFLTDKITDQECVKAEFLPTSKILDSSPSDKAEVEDLEACKSKECRVCLRP